MLDQASKVMGKIRKDDNSTDGEGFNSVTYDVNQDRQETDVYLLFLPIFHEYNYDAGNSYNFVPRFIDFLLAD